MKGMCVCQPSHCTCQEFTRPGDTRPLWRCDWGIRLWLMHPKIIMTTLLSVTQYQRYVWHTQYCTQHSIFEYLLHHTYSLCACRYTQRNIMERKLKASEILHIKCASDTGNCCVRTATCCCQVRGHICPNRGCHICETLMSYCMKEMCTG